MMMMNLSTLSTMSMREERMYPPVRIIIKTLQATFPACHCNININIKAFNTTSMMILQMISIGMVMKEMMVSAMVRWNTRK